VFDWIKSFVDRWAGLVDSATRDLIHWAVHALAGVVYTVFGNVGGAWHDLFTALHWLRSTAADFAGWVVTHFTWLIKYEIPHLGQLLLSYWHDALNFATRLYHLALSAVEAALNVARHLVDDAITWVRVHVYDPLLARAKQLETDLLKWGYAAWQLVTSPPKLAAILLDALVAAAEAAFDRIAEPAGEFALRLVVHQLPKLLKLAEAILAAVL
jgi:hypothetical protein